MRILSCLWLVLVMVCVASPLVSARSVSSLLQRNSDARGLSSVARASPDQLTIAKLTKQVADLTAKLTKCTGAQTTIATPTKKTAKKLASSVTKSAKPTPPVRLPKAKTQFSKTATKEVKAANSAPATTVPLPATPAPFAAIPALYTASYTAPVPPTPSPVYAKCYDSPESESGCGINYCCINGGCTLACG